MSASAILRLVFSTTVLCTTPATSTLQAYQGQGGRSAPAAGATAPKGTVKAAALADTSNATREMARLREDVDRLKVELDLRQQLWRIQEDAGRPGWVYAAPWMTLAVAGIVFAFGWFARIDRSNLADVRKDIDALEKRVERMKLEKLKKRLDLADGNSLSAKEGDSLKGNA